MSSEALASHGRYLEKIIRSGILDFSACYMAVGGLSELIRQGPCAVTATTIDTLGQLMVDPRFSAQTQARFLYRESARALVFLLAHCDHQPLCRNILETFAEVFRSDNVPALRAAAEALGRLPLALPEPQVAKPQPPRKDTIPTVPWLQLSATAGLGAIDRLAFHGRSLVAEAAASDSILVAKFAADRSCVGSLAEEAAWMEYIGEHYRNAFAVPRPIRPAGNALVSLRAVPLPLPGAVRDGAPALAFRAPRDYFHYLNDPRPAIHADDAAFARALFGNARLLGLLAAGGCIHTAPIPLFHNRVQQRRRNDGGLYDWTRAGRLDAWLHSTRFPNLSIAGVRDYEHFRSPAALDIPLYRALGNQVLSLLLIAGSYFRFKRPEKIGIDAHGRPTDVRHLFDETVLVQLIQGLSRHYYQGFVGRCPGAEPSFNVRRLARRMIEEMGVDRHMEEVLRVADQDQISPGEFQRFLVQRGFSEEEARNRVKGKADITILTGPHLGGFNQAMSVPELIDFVAVASARCIADRYCGERFGLPG